MQGACHVYAGTSPSAGGSVRGTGAIPVSLFSWTLAALVFYIAADVLLECRFVLGAVLFSAGHLCMIIGFLTGGEVSGGSAGIILLTAFFVVAACFAVRRHIPHLKGKRLLLPAIAYVAVLSVMASLGVIAGLQTGKLHRDVLCARRCCLCGLGYSSRNEPAGTEAEPGERRGGADPVLSGGVSAFHESVVVSGRFESDLPLEKRV